MIVIARRGAACLRAVQKALGFMLALACLAPAGPVLAAMIGDWPVDGMPPEVGEKLDRAPVDTIIHAASNLQHLLENEGYLLAVVAAEAGRLKVDLGSVETVEVTGLDQKTAALAKRYLEPLTGNPPRSGDVSHVIGLINDIPGVSATLHFERLGDENTYRAVLASRQARQSGTASLHNIPTEDLSAGEASLYQEFYSVATGGDTVRLQLTGVAEESESLSYFGEVGYQAPLNAIGTFGEVRLSYYESTSDFAFQGVDQLDTEAVAAAVVIGHSFHRTVNKARYGYAEFDFRREEDSLSAAREYGLARASWFSRDDTDLGDTVSYNVTVSGGREVSGDGEEFASLRAGLGLIFWLPAISPHSELLIEGAGQIGSSDLPSFELFSFGGQDRQRGFEPFEYAGDDGASISVEIADTFHVDRYTLVGITPYGFADAMYLHNDDARVSAGRPGDNTLLSAGLGIKASFQSGFSINGWVASAVHDEERPDRSHGPEFYIQGQYSW